MEGDRDKTPQAPMTPYEFITALAERRIFLSNHEGTLKYRAPEGAVDDCLKAMLRQYKDGILKTLQHHHDYLLAGPLSYNQQSLFFMHLLEPKSAAYNLALSMRLESPVDKTRLKKAMEILVRRHEQLRATYGHIELGENLIPIQWVHEALLPQFDVFDVPNMPEAELNEKLSAFYRMPFDLEKGPVVRAGLFIQGPARAMFVLVLHHIAADAWSMNLIRRDLAAAYRGDALDEKHMVPRAEYTDFAVSQRRKLETSAGKDLLDYWVKMHKSPAPPLDWANKAKRPAVRRSAGSTHYFPIDASLREGIERAAQRLGITSFAFLLSVFQWLLFEQSGNRDVSVGIPIIGHRDRRFENTAGYFVNPVALRSRRSGLPSFRQHAKATSQELLSALDHRDAPFAAVVESLGGTRDVSRTPVFQVMFNLLSRQTLKDVIDLLYPFEKPPIVDFGGLKATSCPLNQQEGQFDLTLECIDYGDHMLGLLKYCTDLFSQKDAETFAEAFCAKLKTALADPETSVFTTAESEQAPLANESLPVVAISASFTTEFLQEFLDFWFQKLGWRYEARFAPFNQVFQELLNPSSLLRSNRKGYNIVMLRLEDLIHKDEVPSGQSAPALEKLTQTLDELKQAVTTAAKGMSVPLCFVLCPPSPQGKEWLSPAADAIEAFLETLRSTPGVTVLTFEDINRLYPVDDYYEPLGETIGFFPFTRDYLAALSTALMRSLHTLSMKPMKALVLDCDGTLWQGVVGEDGPMGITLGPPQRAFQQFVLDQYHAGVILCLCSKNQENDVWSVFDLNPNMLLKREHFSFWRINWEAKSSNLLALVKDMNIGMDAVAFLDDNPLERAEVGARCPSVFCVEFPDDWKERTTWLKHTWLLDHLRATAEDKKRQEHYRSEQIRDHLKQGAASLAEFLDKLELKIDLNPAQPQDYERLAQLSIRTNQFNTTTLRLTTQEVAQYATTPGMSAHIARVRDRFGDYGLVGAMLAREAEGIYRVDGMFLSCRALGRSVEYRMASYLALNAIQAGCHEIVFPVRTTERNEPARTFLTQLHGFCGGDRDDDNGLRLDAQRVAGFRYETMTQPEESPEASTPQATADAAGLSVSADWTSYMHIARDLHAAQAILNAVEQHAKEKQAKSGRITTATGEDQPETQTEQLIAGVWKRILGTDRINRQVKFFEVGGTSLLMVRVAIELKRGHDIDVSIVNLFQYPTIAELAQFLDGKSTDADTSRQEAAQTAATRQKEALSAKRLPDAFKRLKDTRR